MSYSIGVDLGGTNLRAAVIDASGNLVRSARRSLDDTSVDGCLRTLDAVFDELAPLDADWPIGVGIAAQVRAGSGDVAVAPNLGWRDEPFARRLQAHVGRRVRLVNDLNAIAKGESDVGAGQGTRHLVCVFVGTGTGMGAVVEGKLMEGWHGFATEIGHTKVASPETGRRCGCGQRGCLEAYTSGRHLPELFAEVRARGIPSPLNPERMAMTAGAIERAGADGDPVAQVLWDEVGERLARAVGDVVTVFNPEVLVLGGGVLAAAPSLASRVRERLFAYAGVAQQQGLAVRASTLGDDAGIVGAALLALQEARAP